jgi:hypothetical protein
MAPGYSVRRSARRLDAARFTRAGGVVYEDRAMCPGPTERTAARPTGLGARALRLAGAAAICAGVSLAGPAAAQLGPGDLQRAHALTANTVGWVALRTAMRTVVTQAGIGGSNVEETADTLAVLLAFEDGGGRLDPIVIGAVHAALTAHGAGDGAIAKLFADQGLTLSRARAIACLAFGQAPERRAGIVEPLDLSENDVQSCPKAYSRFRDHWLAIAEPLRAEADAGGEAAQAELSFAGGAMASARAVLLRGGTLDEVASFFAVAVSHPEPITIRALDCENAEASPVPGEVRICYSLVGEIASAVERGIVAGR